MRVTSRGQVTIPADIREKAGLLPETEIAFHFDGNVVTITKASKTNELGRGARLVAQLRGAGDVAVTTDEIMALTRGE